MHTQESLYDLTKQSLTEILVGEFEVSADSLKGVKNSALREMILAEQAKRKAPAPKAKEATKSSRVFRPRRSPADVLEELELICGDVQDRGVKAIAELRGTSVSRLTKKVKAYQVLACYSAVMEAFMAEKISLSFLSEMVVRRDGLDRILEKVELKAAA